jgi:hypothetical protein
MAQIFKSMRDGQLLKSQPVFRKRYSKKSTTEQEVNLRQPKPKRTKWS